VAKEVGMSESALRDLNRIPPRMVVRAGSTLVVPRSGKRQQDVSEALAENAMMALAPDRASARKLTLRAGKRDSVASIARRYRVTIQQVAQWNGTRATASFKRGQAVVVYVPAGKSRVQAKTAVASRAASSHRSSRVASASGSRAASVHRVRAKAPTAVRGKVRVASAR
jgi:membrane-bound lytic murein transglycosylase D